MLSKIGDEMYFPFFYGRQSEFFALRGMLNDPRPAHLLLPIIEPVRSNPSSLLTCLKAFDKSQRMVAVIVNPDKYELKRPEDISSWQKVVLPETDQLPHVLPTYKCSSTTTAAKIDGFLKRFSDREVAFAYASPSLTNPEISALGGNQNVRFHIVLNGKMSTAHQALLPVSKLVDIRDDFNKLDRNADYDGDEFFTDRHMTFPKNYTGYGDYTCIGSEFKPGGGQPGAVAIHAIYKHSSGEIWMEHFVSDYKKITEGDVEDKFNQAATKLTNAVKARPFEFGSNLALDEYAKYVTPPPHCPGLRVNKTLQIHHHICLMLDVLTGKV